MWKDFFYYNKSERRAILVLVGIGILLLFSGTWIRVFHQPEVTMVDSIALDSFAIRDYQKQIAYDSLTWKKKRSQSFVLFDFDPNVADSATLRKLGLPTFLAKRIVNYRNKGGIFRKADDLARIYGLSQEQYQRLKPYIVIDENLLKGKIGQHSSNEKYTKTSELAGNHTLISRKDQESSQMTQDSVCYFLKEKAVKKYPEGTVLDLNIADTTELKRVPGIGRGLARMIVAYRNRLGGYADVRQLQEVAPIDTTVNHWFKIESTIYRPLRVNHAGLDQLRNHPYMNFYKAKVILEYRRKRGKIKGLSQLSMFQEFTEKDLQKLKPYLDFR